MWSRSSSSPSLVGRGSSVRARRERWVGVAAHRRRGLGGLLASSSPVPERLTALFGGCASRCPRRGARPRAAYGPMSFSSASIRCGPTRSMSAHPGLAALLRESISLPERAGDLPRTAPSWVALLSSLPPLAERRGNDVPPGARFACSANCDARASGVARLRHARWRRVRRRALRTRRRRIRTSSCPGWSSAKCSARVFSRGSRSRSPSPASSIRRAASFARSSALYRCGNLLRGLASFSHPHVLGANVSWLADAPGERRTRPWFTLLFYSQPHFPYTSSSPFTGALSTSAGSDPALRYGKDIARGEVRTDADRGQVEGLYRAALAETDAASDSCSAALGRPVSSTIPSSCSPPTTARGSTNAPSAWATATISGMMTLRVPLAFRLPRAVIRRRRRAS